jgi:hypothetical protein
VRKDTNDRHYVNDTFLRYSGHRTDNDLIADIRFASEEELCLLSSCKDWNDAGQNLWSQGKEASDGLLARHHGRRRSGGIGDRRQTQTAQAPQCRCVCRGWAEGGEVHAGRYDAWTGQSSHPFVEQSCDGYTRYVIARTDTSISQNDGIRQQGRSSTREGASKRTVTSFKETEQKALQ